MASGVGSRLSVFLACAQVRFVGRSLGLVLMFLCSISSGGLFMMVLRAVSLARAPIFLVQLESVIYILAL